MTPVFTLPVLRLPARAVCRNAWSAVLLTRFARCTINSRILIAGEHALSNAGGRSARVLLLRVTRGGPGLSRCGRD